MNLSTLKSNWPTALAVTVIVALFIARNKGLLTADQVTYVLAIGGITSTPIVHRMDGPS